MSIFRDEKIWRILTHFWTIAFIVFLAYNFFSVNQYEFLIAPLSVIYVSLLGLYAGTKEFDRWYDLHKSRHPGELFVIVWTVFVFLFLAVSFYLGKEYRFSSEAVAVYIMVLSVFALTQRSKRLYEESQRRKNGLNPPDINR